MFHWRTLLAAFTLSGERRFGQKVVDELRDWIARCHARPSSPSPGTPLKPCTARQLPGAPWMPVFACMKVGPGFWNTSWEPTCCLPIF